MDLANESLISNLNISTGIQSELRSLSIIQVYTIQYTTVQRLASEALLIPGRGKGMDLKRWREHPWTGEEGSACKEDPLPWYFFNRSHWQLGHFFQEFRTIARRFARAPLLILHSLHTGGGWKMAGIWDGGSNLEEYDLRMRLISYIFRNVSRLIELRWYCCTDFGNTKWSNALNHCKSKYNSRRSLPNKLALKTEVFMAIMLRDYTKIHTCIFYHQQILSSWNFYRFLFVPDVLTRLSNFFFTIRRIFTLETREVTTMRPFSSPFHSSCRKKNDRERTRETAVI